MSVETEDIGLGAPQPYVMPQTQQEQLNTDPTSDPHYGYDRYENDDKPIDIQPGIITQTSEPYADVPDYLVLSIISILCCTCLGIVSIVKASNARTNKVAGRYQMARKDSKMALQTAISAIAIGSILTIIIVVLQVIAADHKSGNATHN